MHHWLKMHLICGHICEGALIYSLAIDNNSHILIKCHKQAIPSSTLIKLQWKQGSMMVITKCQSHA